MTFMPRASVDYKREVGDGTSASVVMAPVLWMARTFPEAPAVIERQKSGEWEEVVPHDMTKLLHRPNPFWSGELMWMATIVSLVATGNSMWIKVRDNTARIVELWWVPPGLMEPKWPNDGDTFISHYEYKPAGETIKIDVDDVIHFRYGIDPANIRMGLSPLASLLREVFSDQEAANFAASLLKNMGVPGLVVAPDGDAIVGDDDLVATKKALIEQTTGRNRGMPFVAGAPTKVHQFGFSPQQMDLRTLRRLPEERVTAVLGVPAIVAGLGAGLDRSTFANMAEAREMAYETTMIPLQRIIAADLSNQMMDDFEPDPDNWRVRFDTSEVRVLQEDENAKVERLLSELRSGAITLDEYRRETGRDAGPEHEVYYLPLATQVVPKDGLGEPAPSSSPGSPSPPPGDTVPEDDASEEDMPPDMPPEMEKRIKAWKATAAQRELIKEFMARETALAGVFTSELVDVFRSLGEQCASAFGDVGPKGLKADPDDERIADRILATVNINAFSTVKLKPAFEKHWGRVVDDTLGTINGMTGLNVNLPDETARRLILEGGTRAGLVDVRHSTRQAILRSLAESRELGEGPAAAARRIRDQVPAGRFTNAGPQYRSQLIARTETKYAQNRSSMEAYRASDTVTALLAFDAQGPGESDPDCEARNGMTFTFDEADVELANEHPGGTLSFAPVV